MSSDSKHSIIINDIGLMHDDEKQQKEQSLDNRDQQSVVVRPTILPVATNANVNLRYSNIDTICMSPSPMDTRPYLFRKGTLFDSERYKEILSSVDNPKNINHIKEEEEDDDDDDNDNRTNEEELFDEKALNNERDQEIEHLSQMIRVDQPMDDELADIIMQQLNDVLETTTTTIKDDDDNNNQAAQNALQTSSIIISTQHPYPPVNQTGKVKDHDRPYADYGHLDRQTIAQEFEFNLQPPLSSDLQKPFRLNAKSFAITSWTNVSEPVVGIQLTH